MSRKRLAKRVGQLEARRVSEDNRRPAILLPDIITEEERAEFLRKWREAGKPPRWPSTGHIHL